MSLIKLKIRSTWQGQIGIPQKYVKEALINGTGFRFEYQDDAMELKPEEIKGSIKGLSTESFKDKFSGDFYKLVYFNWHPNQPKQRTLL